LPPSTAAENLIIEAGDDLRNAIADIRRLVNDLRPPVLDQLGLTTAMRDFAESCSSRDAVGVHVTVDLPEGLPRMSAAVEVALYRIMQEAVTNVVRHASADRCTVRLSVEETQDHYMLNLDVSDNGVGMSLNWRSQELNSRNEGRGLFQGAAHHATGVGLSSMRERAEELGGSFRIESQAEIGTRLLASIPMFKE
jgi:signal transduction histidine kinase